MASKPSTKDNKALYNKGPAKSQGKGAVKPTGKSRPAFGAGKAIKKATKGKGT